MIPVSKILALSLVAGGSARALPPGEPVKAPVELQPASRPSAPRPGSVESRSPAATPRVLLGAPSVVVAPAGVQPPQAQREPEPRPASGPVRGPVTSGTGTGTGGGAPPASPRVAMEQLRGYEAFAQKCGRCHPLSRSLEAGLSADEWSAYLRRKERRAGVALPEPQLEEIQAFLGAWSARRAAE